MKNWRQRIKLFLWYTKQKMYTIVRVSNRHITHLGSKVPWFHPGTLEPWNLFCVAWNLGSKVPWFHPKKFGWNHEPWNPKCVAWNLGSMVPWFHLPKNRVEPWNHGTMEPKCVICLFWISDSITVHLIIWSHQRGWCWLWLGKMEGRRIVHNFHISILWYCRISWSNICLIYGDCCQIFAGALWQGVTNQK